MLKQKFNFVREQVYNNLKSWLRPQMVSKVSTLCTFCWVSFRLLRPRCNSGTLV